MTDLRTRIAAVQAQHHHWDYAGALTCACGETFGLGVEAGWQAAVAGWAAHVADAVIRELAAGAAVPTSPAAIQLPPGTLDAGSRRYCICIAGHQGGCP